MVEAETKSKEPLNVIAQQAVPDSPQQVQPVSSSSSKASSATLGESTLSTQVFSNNNMKYSKLLAGTSTKINQAQARTDMPGDDTLNVVAQSPRSQANPGKDVLHTAKEVQQTYRVLFGNVRSILNKRLELQTLVYSSKPSMVLLCESFATKEIPDSLLHLDGYNLVQRRDGNTTRQGLCRGLLLYARTELNAVPINNSKLDKATELVAAEVNMGSRKYPKKVTVCLAYRPPRTPGSALDNGNSERMMEALSTLQGTILCCGDFNLPSINWSTLTSNCKGEKAFIDLFADKFWEQMVHESTHKCGNVLDLVITNDPGSIAGVENLGPLGSSDHDMQMINFLGSEPDVPSKLETPVWAKADFPKMKRMISSINWEERMSSMSGQEMWDFLKNTINSVTKECVPFSVNKNKQRPVWMNEKITHLTNMKRTTWRKYKRSGKNNLQLFSQYKDLQKQCNYAIRRAKRSKELSLAYNCNNNPKAFFSYIKRITKQQSTVGPLKSKNGEIVTDNVGMGNILNKYFSSVFTSENLENMPEAENKAGSNVKFESLYFCRKLIQEKLNGIKNFSAPGPDGIYSNVLKALSSELSTPLSILFNKSMEDGFVPQDWRQANVCPLYKKGSKTDCGNYRPVSLTCILSRIMEGVIKEHLYGYLMANNLIRPSQHGFCKNRSTATNLLTFLEKVTSWVDGGV